MGQDNAPEEHIEQLKMYRYTNDMNFKMQNEWVMYSVLLLNLLQETTSILIYLSPVFERVCNAHSCKIFQCFLCFSISLDFQNSKPNYCSNGVFSNRSIYDFLLFVKIKVVVHLFFLHPSLFSTYFSALSGLMKSIFNLDICI
jgi:hypothetical protein